MWVLRELCKLSYRHAETVIVVAILQKQYICLITVFNVKKHISLLHKVSMVCFAKYTFLCHMHFYYFYFVQYKMVTFDTGLMANACTHQQRQ